MKQLLFILFIGLTFASCQAPQKKAAEETQKPAELVEAKLRIEGMTCTGCEQTIAKKVSELPGIDSISANHLDSTGFVRYDINKTDLTKISEAIEERGYHVVPAAN